MSAPPTPKYNPASPPFHGDDSATSPPALVLPMATTPAHEWNDRDLGYRNPYVLDFVCVCV